MRLFLLVFVAVGFIAAQSVEGLSQCTATIQYPPETIVPQLTWETMPGGVFPNEYMVFAVEPGYLYSFSTCGINDSGGSFPADLTLRTNTGALLAHANNTCGDQAQLDWASGFSGTVHLHVLIYPCITGVGFNQIMHKRTPICEALPECVDTDDPAFPLFFSLSSSCCFDQWTPQCQTLYDNYSWSCSLTANCGASVELCVDRNMDNERLITITGPEPNSWVVIDFASGYLEECCDFINVYQGTGTEGALLGSQLTGNLGGLSFATNGAITVAATSNDTLDCVSSPEAVPPIRIHSSCIPFKVACSVTPAACVDMSSAAYYETIVYDPWCCDVIWDTICTLYYSDLNPSCSRPSWCNNMEPIICDESVPGSTVDQASDPIPVNCGVLNSNAPKQGFTLEGTGDYFTVSLSEMDFPARLWVIETNTCFVNDGVCVAASEFGSGLPPVVSFSSEAGVEYKIIVGGENLTSGTYTLHLSCETAGCTHADACNYDPLALVDDEGCVFVGDPCDDGDPNTLDDVYTEDCLCEGIPDQVTNPLAPSFELYPNPASGTVTVTVDVPGNHLFSIYDLTGRMVVETTINRQMSVSLPNLATGTYVARIGDTRKVLQLQ